MTKSISNNVNRRDAYAEIQKNLASFYRSEAKAFARVAYKFGATEQDLADSVPVTTTAIKKNYPREVSK